VDSSTGKAVKNGRIVDFSYSSELVNATEILRAETSTSVSKDILFPSRHHLEPSLLPLQNCVFDLNFLGD